jgi:hypothetical protein
MNAPHLHLLINHVPAILTPVAAALLILGLLRKSRDILVTALG